MGAAHDTVYLAALFSLATAVLHGAAVGSVLAAAVLTRAWLRRRGAAGDAAAWSLLGAGVSVALVTVEVVE